MGEFTSDNMPTDDIKLDGDQIKNDGFKTDVENIIAPESIKRGKDEFPCFHVSNKEFFQNMQGGRKRIRFSNGTDAQKYMQNTKYQRKFYIKYTDNNGKSLIRSIK
jgi:hypothetical protein